MLGGVLAIVSANPRTIMRILFMDDDDQRHKDFGHNSIGNVVDHAYSAAEAIRKLGEQSYDMVFLDYDLESDPTLMQMDDYESGEVVAEWLAENSQGRQDCTFVVHSLNDQGSIGLTSILRSAGLNVIRSPWAWHKDPKKFRQQRI